MHFPYNYYFMLVISVPDPSKRKLCIQTKILISKHPKSHILLVSPPCFKILCRVSQNTHKSRDRGGHFSNWPIGPNQSKCTAKFACTDVLRSKMEQKKKNGEIGKFLVHHFVGIELCYAPSTCIVHHWPALCTKKEAPLVPNALVPNAQCRWVVHNTDRQCTTWLCTIEVVPHT